MRFRKPQTCYLIRIVLPPSWRCQLENANWGAGSSKMHNEFQDDVLRRMYRQYDTPCDRLVSDPDRLQEFAADYCSRTGKQVAVADLSHRLLNLRRLGEDNGGLPRLRRGYGGRGGSWRS